MAANKKRFEVSGTFRESKVTIVENLDPVVEFEVNATRVRRFDFRRWLGNGFDELVFACVVTVRTMLSSRALRVASIVSYCTGGITYFLDYVAGSSAPVAAAGLLDGKVVQGYIKWLAESPTLQYTGQRNVYALTKCVLVEMIRLQLVSADPSIFPANPYPRASAHVKGQTPFSMDERRQLVGALKHELIAIHRGNFGGSDCEALVVYALALCLRTGLNTIPLIDLSRDCLRNHPLRSNMRMLVHTKWRSHSVVHTQIGTADTQTGITGDGVALLGIVLKRTAECAAAAPERLQNRLWLYRSESRISKGDVRVLVSSDLYRGVKRLVMHHDLRSDEGNPLQVNPSRFRKTLENRLWRLSGGDPFAVARIMNHSLRVSDRHYLAVTPEMEANHRALGEELVSRWRGNSIRESLAAQTLPSTTTRSPLGHCRDPYSGERAPGDGQPCFDFLSCFSCSSYVVVEEEEDLYRLLSFREFLTRERSRAGSTQWIEHYAWIIRMIDAIVQDRFAPQMADAVAERAKARPHPFWADPQVQETARG